MSIYERVAKPVWPDRDPPPLVTNRDQRPEGAPEDPPAVLKLQRAAQRAEWVTRTGYSRALMRTPTIGRYKDVEVIGVWAAPGRDWRWYAGYERTIGAKTGWTWGMVHWWSPIEQHVITITELLRMLRG